MSFRKCGVKRITSLYLWMQGILVLAKQRGHAGVSRKFNPLRFGHTVPGKDVTKVVL